jgi:hypothetical protein
MPYFVDKSLPLTLKLHHTEAVGWSFVPMIIAILKNYLPVAYIGK